MLRKHLLSVVLSCLLAYPLSAQKKITFEAVRYATAMNYLQDTNHQKAVLQSLNTSLFTYLNAKLQDSVAFKMINISTPSGKYKFSHPADNDTSCLHMFLNIAEYATDDFFAANMDQSDSVLRASTKRVLQVGVQLFRHNDDIVYGNVVDVFITHAKGPGIGHPSTGLALLPKSVVEVLKVVFNNIFDSQNGMVQLTVKVQPVYVIDNYISPQVKNMPRVIVDTAKSISAYMHKSERQMLRQAEPFYEEMKLKGRNAQPYPPEVKKAIQDAPNSSASDFICLHQEGRDVRANKTYQLRLYTQINPDVPVAMEELVLTNFLPGKIHTMMNEKDTVARFSIIKNIRDTTKKIFPGSIYNGVDSSSVLSVPVRTPVFGVVHSYIVEGGLNNTAFTIKCSGLKSVMKEIYYDGKLVCIAQGVFKPEIFVVFDASLSAETLNQLFVIGFNRFFE